MDFFVLLFLCLLGNMQSTSAVTGTLNHIESSVIDTADPTELSKNFSYTPSDSPTGETATSTNGIEFVVWDTSHSTTVDNNHTTTDISAAETTTLINGTDTTVTDTLIETTTDNSTSECESATANIFRTNHKENRNQLDKLFEQIMAASHVFVDSKNHAIGESTINLTEAYVELSQNFTQGFELQIRCQNSTTSEEYKADDIEEYKEKQEIVEILSEELRKMIGDETELSSNGTESQNGNESDHKFTGEMMPLFEELHNVITLNKKVKQLEAIEQKQNDIYLHSQKLRDLDEDIRSLKEMINIQNEMLNIVKTSENMKYLYDDQYLSKSNMIRELVNTSNLEEKLSEYQQFLTQDYKDHDIEDALIQLNEIIRPMVLGVLFLVGITGNTILLLVFVNQEDMRTAPNVMIMNLNFSDILGLIFNIFMYILETLVTDWTFGVAFCKIYRFCRHLAITLSVYSIVVISLQRFIAITDFFGFGTFRCQCFGRYQPLMNVVFVWVLASAIASPRAVKANVDSLVCWSGTENDKEFFNVLTYVDFGLYFFLPFIIIGVTSGLSSWRLHYSIKHMPGEAMGQEKVIKARVLSSKVFVALIVVFAVCYMPYFLGTIFTKNIGLGVPFMTEKYISFSLYCLIHANAAFNPIALYLASAKYREYMNIYLYFRYRKRKISKEISAESNITIETRM